MTRFLILTQCPSLKEGSLYFRPMLFLWRWVDSHSLGVWVILPLPPDYPSFWLPNTEAVIALVVSSRASPACALPMATHQSVHPPHPLLSLGTSAMLGPELGDEYKAVRDRVARESLSLAFHHKCIGCDGICVWFFSCLLTEPQKSLEFQNN